MFCNLHEEDKGDGYETWRCRFPFYDDVSFYVQGPLFWGNDEYEDIDWWMNWEEESTYAVTEHIKLLFEEMCGGAVELAAPGGVSFELKLLGLRPHFSFFAGKHVIVLTELDEISRGILNEISEWWQTFFHLLRSRKRGWAINASTEEVLEDGEQLGKALGQQTELFLLLLNHLLKVGAVDSDTAVALREIATR